MQNKQYQLTKKVIIFFTSIILLLKCQILFVNLVPFVYYQQNIELFVQGNALKQGSETIDYSSKNFNQKPIVIVGIDLYYNLYNSFVDLIVSAKDITSNSCTIYVDQQQGTQVESISASALVIDVSQFPFINKIDKSLGSNVFGTSNVYKENFNFSSNLQNKGKKNVSAILTGWSSLYDSSNTYFYLNIEVTDITETGYSIVISIVDSSVNIEDVRYTILEYIENPTTSIYSIASYYETNYKSCSGNVDCYLQPNNPISLNAFDSISLENPFTEFFISFNKLSFNIDDANNDPNIRILNQQLQSNMLNFDYNIQNTGQCKGVTSTVLFFLKKVCTGFINNNQNTCQQTCLIQYVQDNSICLDCPTGQYLLNDLNICQASQPLGYYCSIPDSSYDFNVCEQCNINNCKQCTKFSNQFQCIQCFDSYFLYNGQCSASQPQNTFCDSSTLKCTQCLDINCLTCSDPSNSPSQCLTCQSLSTLYQSKCYSQSSPPKNAYCDWNILSCQQCSDSSCFSCTDPNQLPQVCNQCDSTSKQILYNGKCYSQSNPPPHTFCDWNTLTCNQCSDSNCLSCSDPNQPPQKCLSCDLTQNKQILYQGKCFIQSNPPTKAFCDWNNLTCSQCQDTNCLNCSNPSNTQQQCFQCDQTQTTSILYQDKCFTQSNPPPNAFCDWDKQKCYQCHDSNCLTCTDPNQSTSSCQTCIDSKNYILLNGQCIFDCELNKQNAKCKKITEIKESYSLENDQTYKKYQSMATASVVLSFMSPGVNFSKQFIQIQKINFLYVLDIMFNQQLYSFLKSIEGQNFIQKHENINFLKSLFEESEQDLKNQILTLKTGQTSIIQTAGGIFTCILICILFIIPSFFRKTKIIPEISVIQSLTQEPSIKDKLKGYFQTISLNIINFFNDIMFQIGLFEISLQIVNFTQSEQEISFMGAKVVLILIFGAYFIGTFTIYLIILNKKQNFNINCKDDIQKTYQSEFYDILLNEKIEQKFISRNFKLIQITVESLFIPVSIVIFYQSYLVETILCIIFQLIITILSIIYRPQKSLIDNIQIIADGLLWMIVFCLLNALGEQTYKLFDNVEYKEDILTTINNISIWIIIFLQALLFLGPLISIIKLILKIPALVRKVKQYFKEKKKKQETESAHQLPLESSKQSLKSSKQDMANSKIERNQGECKIEQYISVSKQTTFRKSDEKHQV